MSTRDPRLQISLAIQRAWYGDPLAAWWLQLLRPLSWLYRSLAALRRCWLLHKLKKNPRAASRAIVVVVGNITVGGTGKTPLLLALAQELTRRGYRVGIVSRGYGGKAPHYPLRVDAATLVAHCGDEPALLARRSRVPLVVDPRRARAVAALEAECDVILSDDGLQHYAMARDIEIIVLDGARGIGNGLCLPAGPLRETVARLSRADFVICNGSWRQQPLKPVQPTPMYEMHLVPGDCVNVRSGERIPVEKFFRKQLVHAVAGIGNPERFFNVLRNFGCQLMEHTFADHHRYVADDLHFGDTLPIIMTEKDAVKCQSFASPQSWYLEVTAQLPTGFYEQLQQRLNNEKR